MKQDFYFSVFANEASIMFVKFQVIHNQMKYYLSLSSSAVLPIER